MKVDLHIIEEGNFLLSKLNKFTYPSIENEVWKLDSSYLHNYHEDYGKLMALVDIVISEGYEVTISNTEIDLHFCRIEKNEFTMPVCQVMDESKKLSIWLALIEFAKKKI